MIYKLRLVELFQHGVSHLRVCLRVFARRFAGFGTRELAPGRLKRMNAVLLLLQSINTCDSQKLLNEIARWMCRSGFGAPLGMPPCVVAASGSELDPFRS